jgi:hypothetical protein
MQGMSSNFWKKIKKPKVSAFYQEKLLVYAVLKSLRTRCLGCSRRRLALSCLDDTLLWELQEGT